MNDFKDRFNKLIKERNTSAYKLAEVFGLTQSTMSNYRKGISVPKKATMNFIAAHFNVSPEWLATGKGKMELPIAAEPDIKYDLDELNKKFKHIEIGELVTFIIKNDEELMKNKIFKLFIENKAAHRAIEILKNNVKKPHKK